MEYLYNMENLYDGVLYNKDCFVKFLFQICVCVESQFKTYTMSHRKFEGGL